MYITNKESSAVSVRAELLPQAEQRETLHKGIQKAQCFDPRQVALDEAAADVAAIPCIRNEHPIRQKVRGSLR